MQLMRLLAMRGSFTAFARALLAIAAVPALKLLSTFFGSAALLLSLRCSCAVLLRVFIFSEVSLVFHLLHLVLIFACVLQLTTTCCSTWHEAFS